MLRRAFLALLLVAAAQCTETSGTSTATAPLEQAPTVAGKNVSSAQSASSNLVSILVCDPSRWRNHNALVQGNFGFYHAFIASLSVIIVSELGDKTWFIAAIMAMRHSRLVVFAGAMAALILMTVLSGSFLAFTAEDTRYFSLSRMDNPANSSQNHFLRFHGALRVIRPEDAARRIPHVSQ